MASETDINPRYLRFLRSLVVGAALGAVPLSSACDSDDECTDDSCVSSVDAAPVDAGVTVDGPLPPPDLPKLA